MAVHGYGQDSLRLFLADHILIEYVLYFGGSRNLGNRFGYFALFVLGQNLIAQRDTLITDINRRPGDELPDCVLRLTAERTT